MIIISDIIMHWHNAICITFNIIKVGIIRTVIISHFMCIRSDELDAISYFVFF